MVEAGLDLLPFDAIYRQIIHGKAPTSFDDAVKQTLLDVHEQMPSACKRFADPFVLWLHVAGDGAHLRAVAGGRVPMGGVQQHYATVGHRNQRAVNDVCLMRLWLL